MLPPFDMRGEYVVTVVDGWLLSGESTLTGESTSPFFGGAVFGGVVMILTPGSARVASFSARTPMCAVWPFPGASVVAGYLRSMETQ